MFIEYAKYRNKVYPYPSVSETWPIYAEKGTIADHTWDELIKIGAKTFDVLPKT